uniref:Cadherin domain-containing protein n=1 Tax=Scophthalmus maximus TaxID=52904 RepID=A0A8D3B913_SCOMX
MGNDEMGLLLLLVLALMLSTEARQKRPQTLKRQKREWILPPAKLLENTDYTHKEFIAKIRSDKDKGAKVEYYLSGPGADKPPFNLFVVDQYTGFVTVTGILDREKYPSFNLTGIAKHIDGTLAEDSIPMMVTVLDQNDNAPTFELHTGNITEASKKGTFVMQIEGKDNDQAGTSNSEISYSIVSQEPEGTGHMFTIDKKTGNLYVNEPTLDRETYDSYKLVIKGIDLGGAAGGLTGTGTVEIKVLDINDNIPTLEKSEYSGTVDENVMDVVVMRIKALDKDLENTDNWVTVFSIAKGNEDNIFSIETDKETNEGILKLIKPLDFEEIQNLELGLLIENVAPFLEGGAILMDVDVKVGQGGPLLSGAAAAGVAAGVSPGADLGVDLGDKADIDIEGGGDVGLNPWAGLAPGIGVGPGVGVGLETGVKPGPATKPHEPVKSYPIKISVNNVPEVPAFIPDTKTVPVSEDPNEATEDGVITVFAAVDPDTGKPAEDVSYAKGYDPDSWLTINAETAEIKLNKIPDRESSFLVNGTYIAKILVMTKDIPSKTATGTIAIQVTDSNDHCPTLITKHNSLCSNEKTVFVTGCDEDVSPNSAPFTFRIITDGTQGNWVVEVINETSAALHSQEPLWPGSYELQLEVLDAQGLSCSANEVVIVDVCTCVETEACSLMAARLGTTSPKLSAPAIGLLLMAMCLLLFIPLLLLLCHCGGKDTIFPEKFNDLPFDAKEHLISYRTEGRGDDKAVPLQNVPITLGTQTFFGTAPASNFTQHQTPTTFQTATIYNKFEESSQSLREVNDAYRFSREAFNHGNGKALQFSRKRLGIQNRTVLFEDIALPDTFLDDYYSQKVVCALPVKDGLLEYDFEGHGSFAGSVGCCSFLESDNDLQFLNDLGTKFKTLADICSPPISKPSLTCKEGDVVHTTVDFAEPVIKPQIEHIVETKNANITSTNISKLSVNTVSTEPPSMKHHHSKVTNISHSSNIRYSATLPRPVQAVVLEQQPVYYTTSPVIQPMHYVIQPQLQSTVLLADVAHGTNFTGLYVVSGSQSPSGLTISGLKNSPSGHVIPGLESSKSSANPTTPVSPTLLLPGSSIVSPGSLPVEGWKMILPNPDDNYIFLKDRSSPPKALGVDPGSSQGTLSRDAILVKEDAPPQGVLGPAAQGSVYGILPGHIVAKMGGVVAVNTNLGQTWCGHLEQVGFLRLVTVLGVDDGQPRIGMAHVIAVKPEVTVAGMCPPGVDTVGIKQITVKHFQGIYSQEQTIEYDVVLEARSDRLESQKEEQTINVENNFTTAETTKTHGPLKEGVIMENKFKDNGDPDQMAAEETQSEDVIIFTLEQDTTVDYASRLVKVVYENNEDIQASKKFSDINLEKATVTLLAGSDVLHKSFEQSDSTVKSGVIRAEIFPDQLNTTTDVSANKHTNTNKQKSQTSERSYPQDNAGEAKPIQSEQQEKHIISVCFSKEYIVCMITQLSCTETVYQDQILILFIKKKKKIKCTHEEDATSIIDHVKIVDEQIHGITEENVGRQEAGALIEGEESKSPQLSIVEGSEDMLLSEPQS